jgi:hypothetical protein
MMAPGFVLRVRDARSGRGDVWHVAWVSPEPHPCRFTRRDNWRVLLERPTTGLVLKCDADQIGFPGSGNPFHVLPSTDPWREHAQMVSLT